MIADEYRNRIRRVVEDSRDRARPPLTDAEVDLLTDRIYVDYSQCGLEYILVQFLFDIRHKSSLCTECPGIEFDGLPDKDSSSRKEAP